MFREICEGAEALKSIAHSLRELVRLEKAERAATGFLISQINGGNMQSDIKGIVKGATGQFTAATVPAGGLLQTGAVPKWAADDANVILTPAADGLSCSVATVANDQATTFNLTVSGINSAGVPITTTVSVALLAATPVPATGFDIKQTS